MIGRPPRSTLFPSPTLFRSHETVPARRSATVHAAAVVDDLEAQGVVLVAHDDGGARPPGVLQDVRQRDRKSTRLNSSHLVISYAVFCLKKKKRKACDHAHQH